MNFSRNTLNVLRVALDRADMNYRATGFKDFDVAAAKECVRTALATQPPATPAAPAVQASGEREAYVRYLTETYPDNYSQEDAERWWHLEHVSALTWQARAALASPPAKSPERNVNPRLQEMCVAWGAYWRGSDSHGVDLTKEQAVELLQESLGVEVAIK